MHLASRTRPAVPSTRPLSPQPQGLTSPFLRQLPMALTLGRVGAIPAFVLLWQSPGAAAAAAATGLFVAAAVTDFLDGYLSRRWHVTSDFGAFLDPVADKLMVTAALVLLTASSGLASPLCTLCAMTILGREIAMSALREWAAGAGPAARASVAVGWAGKLKTTVQLVALSTLCLARVPGTSPRLFQAGTALLAVAAFLTLWSVAEYFILIWPYLIGRRCPKTGAELDR